MFHVEQLGFGVPGCSQRNVPRGTIEGLGSRTAVGEMFHVEQCTSGAVWLPKWKRGDLWLSRIIATPKMFHVEQFL